MVKKEKVKFSNIYKHLICKYQQSLFFQINYSNMYILFTKKEKKKKKKKKWIKEQHAARRFSHPIFNSRAQLIYFLSNEKSQNPRRGGRHARAARER